MSPQEAKPTHGQEASVLAAHSYSNRHIPLPLPSSSRVSFSVYLKRLNMHFSVIQFVILVTIFSQRCGCIQCLHSCPGAFLCTGPLCKRIRPLLLCRDIVLRIHVGFTYVAESAIPYAHVQGPFGRLYEDLDVSVSSFLPTI